MTKWGIPFCLFKPSRARCCVCVCSLSLVFSHFPKSVWAAAATVKCKILCNLPGKRQLLSRVYMVTHMLGPLRKEGKLASLPPPLLPAQPWASPTRRFTCSFSRPQVSKPAPSRPSPSPAVRTKRYSGEEDQNKAAFPPPAPSLPVCPPKSQSQNSGWGVFWPCLEWKAAHPTVPLRNVTPRLMERQK